MNMFTIYILTCGGLFDVVTRPCLGPPHILVIAYAVAWQALDAYDHIEAIAR